MTPVDLWKRYEQYLCTAPSLGLSLDISRMKFGDDFLPSLEPRLQAAYDAMAELEREAAAARPSGAGEPSSPPPTPAAPAAAGSGQRDKKK